MRKLFESEVSKTSRNIINKLNESTLDNNKRPEFYGVPEVYFIYHGDWSDPEVEYKGNLYNYYDLEQWLLDDYKDILEEKGEDYTEEGFKTYVTSDPDRVYNALEELNPTESVDGEDSLRESNNPDDKKNKMRSSIQMQDLMREEKGRIKTLSKFRDKYSNEIQEYLKYNSESDLNGMWNNRASFRY